MNFKLLEEKKVKILVVVAAVLFDKFLHEKVKTLKRTFLFTQESKTRRPGLNKKITCSIKKEKKKG